MAVSEKAINFIQGNLERGQAIPGQSLTNSPEEPYNWEKPAEYTNTKEAMMFVFESLTVPETTANILLSLNKGIGIIDIASITLYTGFTEGKWNPDLMVTLIEPTIYMLLAIAEQYTLDVNEVELQLCGMINENSALYNELHKYFKHLSFQPLPDVFDYVDDIQTLPSHYFAHTFLFAACV